MGFGLQRRADTIIQVCIASERLRSRGRGADPVGWDSCQGFLSRREQGLHRNQYVMSESDQIETPVVVQLTPPARGAVATLVVEGCGAAAIVGRLVRRRDGKPLDPGEAGRPLLASFRIGHSAEEEVVVHARNADWIEIHCHGGPIVVEQIASQLTGQGCQPLDWRPWVARTGADPLQTTAQIALASARTARTAAPLLDQYCGSLRAAVEQLRRSLARGQRSTAREQIASLLRWAPLGTHLTRSWKVVFAGRPNVGKSSLVNALAGFGRSIVDPMPGTTRDVVTVTVAIEGLPLELCDTAGLHSADDPLDRAGVERAQAELKAAELVVLVLDRSRPADPADTALLEQYPQALVVMNKCDLPAEATLLKNALPTSALRGEGVEALARAVVAKLVPDWPPPGTAIPFTPEQVAVFERVASLLVDDRLEAARAALDGC